MIKKKKKKKKKKHTHTKRTNCHNNLSWIEIYFFETRNWENEDSVNRKKGANNNNNNSILVLT